MAKATTQSQRTATTDDRTTRPATQRPTATETDIARRAHDLYLARGGEHGHDVEDWLQAERELNGSALAV
jgi:hypothetical protein